MKKKKKNRMENLCYLKIEWRINSREDEEEDGGFRSCSWKERRTKGKGFRVSLWFQSCSILYWIMIMIIILKWRWFQFIVIGWGWLQQFGGHSIGWEWWTWWGVKSLDAMFELEFISSTRNGIICARTDSSNTLDWLANNEKQN
jgi:hypothetical protein